VNGRLRIHDETPVGGSRMVDMLSAERLPRICWSSKAEPGIECPALGYIRFFLRQNHSQPDGQTHFVQLVFVA
jgi:hypothetical protein